MDKLDAIRSFVRVAELASFTRAAAALDLSRAMVSQQVAALERELSVRLFNRTTRRVSLTGEGGEYFERCRRVLAELRSADEAVMHARERPQGLLRVDVPVAFGRHLLVPALPALTERYPGLRLEVALNDRVADLVAERVDVALRVGKIRQAGLIARRVAAMRYVTVASPDYLARAGTPRSIEDLKSHLCIGTLSAESGRLREWQFERGAALLRLRPRCHMSFNQPEAVAAAALAGGGIAQSVDLIVAESLATGRLREVLGEYSAAGPAMSIVYPQSERQSARVRVFADFCAKLLRDWGEKVRARR